MHPQDEDVHHTGFHHTPRRSAGMEYHGFAGGQFAAELVVGFPWNHQTSKTTFLLI